MFSAFVQDWDFGMGTSEVVLELFEAITITGGLEHQDFFLDVIVNLTEKRLNPEVLSCVA